jgi:hypothetical protein
VALESKVDSFVPSSGSQTINPGFQPKVLICWTNGRTAAGAGSDHARFSYGHATDRGGTAVQYHWCFASEDNIGTADVYDGSGTASLLKLTNGTTATVVFDMVFTEFVAGGFTVNVSTATLLPVVNYIALGGTGVEDALAGQTNWVTNTGAHDVTVAAGFGQPHLVFFPMSWHGASTPATQDGIENIGFGVKSASANGRCWRIASQDAATTQATAQTIRNNRVCIGGAGTISNIDTDWQLSADSAWPTDGFEVNRLTGVDSGWPFYWLAIRFSTDVTVTAGEGTARTTTGTSSLTSSGTPKLALLLTTMQTAANSMDSTGTECMYAGIGAVDGSGSERFAAFSDDDAQATASVCGTYQSTSKALQYYAPSSNAVDAEADGAVSGSNFELNFTDAAASAWVYEWVTLGEASAAPGVIPNLAMAPYLGAY